LKRRFGKKKKVERRERREKEKRRSRKINIHIIVSWFVMLSIHYVRTLNVPMYTVFT
jgi:hypothetical protein